MDDLQEQMSTDKQNFGKFVFVSSWTADDTESIPMWRMYTPKLIQEQMQGKNEEMARLQMRTLSGQSSLSFNYYDLYIRDECFSDMSVTLSPDISESAKIFVELLIKEYNPDCTIKQGVLTNLIR